MTCTGIGRMWNSRVGILGCHEEPAGKASVGQTADRPDEGRRDQDLVWRAKIRGQDARIGHRGRRTGSAVRGHNEVKDIYLRAGVKEPACALECVRRLCAGGKLERRPQSSGLVPVGVLWAAGP